MIIRQKSATMAMLAKFEDVLGITFKTKASKSIKL